LFDRTDKEDKIALDELAASIRELGLQQPPKVRPSYVYPCGHNVEVKEIEVWNILYDHQKASSDTRRDSLMERELSPGRKPHKKAPEAQADVSSSISPKELQTTEITSRDGSEIHGNSAQRRSKNRRDSVDDATTNTTGTLGQDVKSIISSLPACPICGSSASVPKTASRTSRHESIHEPSGQLPRTSSCSITTTRTPQNSPQDSNALQPPSATEENDSNKTSADEAVALLANSIVRCNFVLVYGERRLRAVRDILKRDTITVLVDDAMAGEDASAATVVENLQRRDLHPMDAARGIALLRRQGTSIKNVAKRLGRREEWVKERLKLCDLPADVQDLYRHSTRITYHQALGLHDYTHGGKDNKGFPALIAALAKSLDTGQLTGMTGAASLSGVAGAQPSLVQALHHAYSSYEGRWGGNYFDTRSTCIKCPFAAYRPGYYDGVGYCLLPTHYAALKAKGEATYNAAQEAALAARGANGGADVPAPTWQPEPQKTAAQKGKETRQRHKDQKAAYYPTVSAIERAIDMIPAVDTIDVAVLCAYTLTTDHVDRQAIEQVMTRHNLKSFPGPWSRPGRAEIERLRSFNGVDLVRYTLEALLLTQAIRARDYDPGRGRPDPVLALYLPGQAASFPAEDVSQAAREEDDEDLADDELSNEEDESA